MGRPTMDGSDVSGLIFSEAVVQTPLRLLIPGVAMQDVDDDLAGTAPSMD